MLEPDWNTAGVLGAARGANGADEDTPIGTQHLLAGVCGAKGRAAEALNAVGVTRSAAIAVLRRKRETDDDWQGDEGTGASVAATDILGDDGGKRDRYTPAAAAALRSAVQFAREDGADRLTTDHLLRALLARDDTGAAELLTLCGSSPQAVRDRLAGVTTSTGDGLDPLLHPTRDILLGRARYQRIGLRRRLIARLASIQWADLPVDWVRHEAGEQARRLGDRTVRTEHLLLAALAAREVTAAYPHMVNASGTGKTEPYAGGAELAERGVSYARLHRALRQGEVALPKDPRSADDYVAEAVGLHRTRADAERDPAPARSTGPLVESLLAEPTRARALVETVTSGPAAG
ncbi:Clp protease N-terminal domain-containing protein [Streptomyces spiramenti]|uniref:Clp protease N-terminal domain-containing protein n=1 Tax=Streptomyces spiramenti TaxID=2720606 RepID=UPI003083F65B